MKHLRVASAMLCLAFATLVPAGAASDPEEERVVIETLQGFDPCCGSWDRFDAYRDVRMDLACPDGVFEVALFLFSSGGRIENPYGYVVEPTPELLAEARCVQGTATVQVPDLHEGHGYLWTYKGHGVEEPVSMVMTGIRA